MAGWAVYRRRGVHALCRAGLAESMDGGTPVDRAVSTPRRSRTPFRNTLGAARQSISFLLRTSGRTSGEPETTGRRRSGGPGHRLWLGGAPGVFLPRIHSGPRPRTVAWVATLST